MLEVRYALPEKVLFVGAPHRRAPNRAAARVAPTGF